MEPEMKRFICAFIAAAILSPATASAADVRDTACKTTKECQEESNRIRGVIVRDETSATAKVQDQFYWMGRINMASTVMLLEEGIIPARLAKPIAEGVQYSIAQASQPGGKRPTDVLQVERIISDKAGPDATLIHSGRSRQDIGASIRGMRLRRAVLDTADALMSTRQLVLDIACRNTETFVPAYTNGVQAQPVSYGHYLMAYADSFARDAQRLRDIYPRLNLSPMGTAVLANSSWPLNRVRLADLLGFDGVVVNSYDSGQIHSMDVPLEAAAIMSSIAIRVGAMLQDIHTQYHQSHPWMLLDNSQTYTSSAMPQKLNPGVVMTARAKASDVVASTQLMLMRVHNITPGMTDYKGTFDASKTFVWSVEMLNQLNGVLKALRVDPKRALEELNGDWTTSMELAETLQRLHQVPFRVGHHFATLVVNDAKAKNLLPNQYPYDAAAKLYADSAQKYQLPPGRFPLDEAAFRATLSAEMMVRTRVGIGGPQPAEVQRMIKLGREALARDQTWLDERNNKLLEAEARLNTAFAKYLGN
jgi:argininosuccinate lyase